MYQLLTKLFVICYLFFSFICCGFIDLSIDPFIDQFVDLRPINITTTPAQPYDVLPHANSPVILGFDTQMKERETENVMQVISPNGTVDGDLFWKGNELHFVPASSWMKGIRYVLKLFGTVYSRDGRELYLSRELPFYAMDVVPLPYLVTSYPVDGASTIAFVPGETMLSLSFSLPMDRYSVEAALSCDGIDQKAIDYENEAIFVWSDDDRILSIRARNPLSAWTVYRWSVSDKALSRDGAPLAKAVSGSFITDKDDIFPRVINVVPLIKADGNNSPWGPNWIRNDINLDNGLGPGQVIGVEFNKNMDIERLRTSFSFEPSLPGRLEIISSRNVIYIPDNHPEPEMNYALKISGDIRDARGLKMGADHIEYFASDIPFLKVISLTFDDAPVTEIFEPKKAEFYPVYTKAADNDALCFTIRFSLPVSEYAQREGTHGISLTPFFPGILGSASLRALRWLAPDLVRMEWEGVQYGKPGEPHYYKLTLPGGRSGISNGAGSYLKEETYFYIEAVKK